jgi:hypothetical protein
MNRKYSGHRRGGDCWDDGGGDGDGDGDGTAAAVPVRLRRHVHVAAEVPLPPQLNGMGTRFAAGEGTW